MNKTLIAQKIDKYYWQSFRVPPQQLNDSFLDIIGELEKMLQNGALISSSTINELLTRIFCCLENKDFVLLRDLLRYELCPLVAGQAKVKP